MTKLGLRLEVKVDGEWRVLNHRDTRDYGDYPKHLLELLKHRDNWAKTDYNNHSFRIVYKLHGRAEKVVA